MNNRLYTLNTSVPNSGSTNQIMYPNHQRGGNQPFFPPQQRQNTPQGMPPRQRMMGNTPAVHPMYSSVPTYQIHAQQPWQIQFDPFQQYQRAGVPQQYAMNANQANQFSPMPPVSSPYPMNPAAASDMYGMLDDSTRGNLFPQSFGYYPSPGANMEYMQQPGVPTSSSVASAVAGAATTPIDNRAIIDDQPQPPNTCKCLLHLQPGGADNHTPPNNSFLNYYTQQPPTFQMNQTRPPSNPGQKERKIIRIQDPTTGVDITDNLMSSARGNKMVTPPLNTDTGSSRATPVADTPPPAPVQGPSVAAEFAAKVAAVAVQYSTPPSQQQPVVNPGALEAPVVIPVAMVAPPPTVDAVIIQEPVCDEELSSSEPCSIVTTTDSPTSDIADSLPATPSPSAEASSTEIESTSSEINVTINVDKQTTPQSDKRELVESETAAQHVSDGEIVPAIEASVDTSTLDASELSAEAIPLEVKDKKSRKQKMKDLNEKGKAKEGSDMDLFMQSESPSVSAKEESVTQPPVPTITPATPIAGPVATPAPVFTETEKPPKSAVIVDTKQTNHIHQIVAATTTTEPSQEAEQAKVQEKNEKNAGQAPSESAVNNVTPAQNVKPSSNDLIEKNKEAHLVLKYHYKEDQWSPLNPEGKRIYDRDFLLSLQGTCKAKPDGLPRLPDVILEKPRQMDTRASPMMIDFTPGFVRSALGGGRMSGSRSMDKNRSQQRDRGGKDMPKKVIDMQIGQVKLKRAENAWKPSRGKDKLERDQEEMETEDLYKRVRSILNKLTPQKFQTLVNQMMDLKIDTADRLRGVIDLIFEKAIDEPSFSVPYAHMCQRIQQLKLPVDIKPRVILLNRCQKEFEKDRASETDMEQSKKKIEEAATEEEKKVLQEELNYAYAKSKRRSIGNIRFIGELFKLNMLTENIMHECIVTLLKSNDEDNLECLCRLLSTIGKELDHEKGKPRMDQYFQQKEKIIKKKEVSSRTRFMLQDVIELRRNNWVPRRVDNAPKTIAEIHKEAAKESAEKSLLSQMVVVPPAMNLKKDNRRGSRSGMGQSQESDGWKTVTVSTKIPIDPNRMKLPKTTMDENFQLGPGGRPGFSWGRGSSGGGKQNQEPERPSTPGNRFSALSQHEGGGFDSRSRGSGSRGMVGRLEPKGRQSQPTQRGKMSRYSMEAEKEAALAVARNFNVRDGQGSRQGSRRGSHADASREGSRDNSRTREPEPEKAVPPQPVAAAVPVPILPEMDENMWEKKTRAILDEYLQILDIKEAILCVEELHRQSNFYFVSNVINHVLERSQQARKHSGHLLHDLVSKGTITVENYLKGLHEVLEYAEDMEIDVPKIWEYLGELIGPMVQDGSVPLSFLRDAVKPVQAKAGHLMSEILHCAGHRLGKIKVGDLWRNSGLSWSDFLKPDTNVDEFLKKHDLEFTCCTEQHKPAGPMPLDQISQELRKLLTKGAPNENVFDWIEEHVGEPKCKEKDFVRVLMTEVCTSAIKGSGTSSKMDEQVLKKRSDLLQKYLDHSPELELQSLYALQALVHKLEHPSYLLQTFFDTLYDEDVISEDAFYQWESSKDPAEQEGKGVAFKSVVRFFTWLQETDADEESKEDS
ncbi:eukaryotic translation initiation factor 4 gamma 1-like isoform X3 [Tubulanus polymorphus]|uniref:eukaryotic translation initiation factor 4 gamma 1-like isoform X3 n=1 Tax=Tubulanus polymorphus TaxID=672921 RepID=UPI003DA67E26